MSNSSQMVQEPRPGYLIYQPPVWPLATYVIIGLNALVFIVITVVDGASHPALNDFLLRTLTGIGSDAELLVRLGASFGPYTRRGEYWRLVTPMFLHIGLLHFAMNNYALYVLGRFLERIYGNGRFAFLYVAAGMGSAFISMRMSDRPAAGASGAIFGIAGLMLVAGYAHRESIPRQWGRAFGKGILPFIVLNLGLGLALHQWLDNWAHIGGLVSGMVLGLLVPPPRRELVPGAQNERPSQALAGITVVVVAIAMVASFQNYRLSIAVTRLLEEGRGFRAVRRDDWALQRFQEAAKLSPRDERPHEQLGLLYLGGSHWTDAIREYNEALRLNYLSVDSQLGLAQAYWQTGNPAKAQEYLQAIQKKYPETAEAQYELGSLYNQHNLYAEAIEHYQNALRLNPDLAEAHNNLAWLYATSDAPQFRNPAAALEHAQRAVELTQWKQPDFIDTLAEALYANQNFAEAVKVQTRAIQLNPHNQEFIDHLNRYRKAAGSPAHAKGST